MVSQHSSKVLGSKRNLPGNQFVSETSQSILITLGIARPGKLLWSYIAEGIFFSSLITNESVPPVHKREICQESMVICIKKDILWLDIAMDTIVFMRIYQNLSYF